MFGVERDFRDPGRPVVQTSAIEAPLGGENQQRALHRVADHLAVPQLAVVAQNERGEQGIQVAGVAFAVLRADRPFRAITFARHGETPASKEKGAHCHLVQRECSCLVRADDSRGAQGFNAGQFLNDGAMVRHPAHTERERHCDDDWQPFGHGSYRKSDCIEQSVNDIDAAQVLEKAEQSNERQRDASEPLSEDVELFLQRAPDVSGCRKLARDTPHRGLGADHSDDQLAAPSSHQCIHECDIPALGERGIEIHDCRSLFGNGLRFPCQRGLVN